MLIVNKWDVHNAVMTTLKSDEYKNENKDLCTTSPHPSYG